MRNQRPHSHNTSAHQNTETKLYNDHGKAANNGQHRRPHEFVHHLQRLVFLGLGHFALLHLLIECLDLLIVDGLADGRLGEQDADGNHASDGIDQDRHEPVGDARAARP